MKSISANLANELADVPDALPVKDHGGGDDAGFFFGGDVGELSKDVAGA